MLISRMMLCLIAFAMVVPTGENSELAMFSLFAGPSSEWNHYTTNIGIARFRPDHGGVRLVAYTGFRHGGRHPGQPFVAGHYCEDPAWQQQGRTSEPPVETFAEFYKRVQPASVLDNLSEEMIRRDGPKLKANGAECQRGVGSLCRDDEKSKVYTICVHGL